MVYQTDTTIKDCENWIKFEYVFIPSVAGLQHLVIGNFPSFGTNIDSLPLTNYCGSVIATEPYLTAYYIIDDVSLYCIDCDTTALCNVVFPDAFTPNNDRLNDSWSPIIQTDCSQDISNYLLRIFDRWGAVVYTSYNPTDAWTGANYPTGTYVYYLQYDDKSRTQVTQGSLELIR